MIKVKAKASIVEQAVSYSPGDVFELPEERLNSLGDVVEVVHTQKSVEEPPKDKMVSKPIKKKSIGRKKKK